MIWPRSAILHNAAASSVEGTSGLTRFHRAQDGDAHLLLAERVGEVDRVLDDVDLDLQVRRDVDRGIGDDQRLVVVRHVHDEAMADAPGGAQAGVARDDRAHELVGVQAALHQRLGPAFADQRDGLGGGVMAVLGVDDLEAADVEAMFLQRPRESAAPDRPESAR